jgi:transcriptional regulator of NAD metabolism
MTSQERRDSIEKMLKGSKEPITATSLAKTFSVSRQLIVGDIALMRAAGLKITATPRGYVMNSEDEQGARLYTIACNHDSTNMAEELYTIVDNGGAIIDVTVEHPIYGQIVGELRIFSRYDVDLFLKRLKESQVQPLSRLTGGIHLHTIQCKDDQTFSRIKQALKKENILFE